MLELALQTLVALAAVVAWAAYVLGWFRLRAGGYTAPRWRLLLYGLGLASLVAALLPPLEHLASERFSAHMGQHLLLTQVAAPLLVLGNPLPLVLWGLPRRVRRPLAATLRRGKPVRTALAALTFLPVAGVLHTAAVWVWHLPVLYDAAAEHELVHVLEHVVFLGTAILFWWPIVLPAPRLRPGPHPGFQILYLLLATAQSTALGMALAVPERAFYPYYVRRAAELGISAVDDQMLGAGLMWSGGHMYLLPILVILWGLARDREAAA